MNCLRLLILCLWSFPTFTPFSLSPAAGLAESEGAFQRWKFSVYRIAWLFQASFPAQRTSYFLSLWWVRALQRAPALATLDRADPLQLSHLLCPFFAENHRISHQSTLYNITHLPYGPWSHPFYNTKPQVFPRLITYNYLLFRSFSTVQREAKNWWTWAHEVIASKGVKLYRFCSWRLQQQRPFQVPQSWESPERSVQ